ncbi:eukaryotic translation initiation factor 3 protein [Fusarium avenaceum]|nr:eukaryotic translation initiation factor 3 protein [Fusarium avenaceum]
MPLESKYAVRVSSIPSTVSREEFCAYVKALFTKDSPKKSFLSFLKKYSGKRVSKLPSQSAEPQTTSLTEDDAALVVFYESLRISIAEQHGSKIGTISARSKGVLKDALLRYEKSKGCRSQEWGLTSNFQGITVLYEYNGSDEVEMDICNVHGLGGNAMDTWTAEGGAMWPRDYLSSSEYFEKSRVMTFGYDSDLTNRETVMTLDNWAETLLQSLDEVRISEKADWGDFLVAVAAVTSGLRQDVLNSLRAFNPESVWDKKAFLKLEPRPPFKCFAEGLKMKIKGILQHVVTHGSASLDPENPAFMIMQANHNSICKFDKPFGPFITISCGLRDVYGELIGRSTKQPVIEHRRFGHPRFVAHAYPPHKGAWWEGSGMNEIQHRLSIESPFIGRSDEMNKLESTIVSNTTRRKLTVVKGIAGIGKTELLMRVVAREKYRRNVFFLRADRFKSLEDSLADLCSSIGFDLIENPNVNWEHWQRTSIAERIQIFVSWLGEECNRSALLVLDDAEIFDAASIQSALRFPAWHIVMSTRNSILRGTGRDNQDIRLQPLDEGDTVSLLKSLSENLDQDQPRLIAPEDCQPLAKIVAGHPLAAQNVIPFLLDILGTCNRPVEEFVRIFTSGTMSERRVFFEFSPHDTSLWDVFSSSLEQLKKSGGSEKAVKLFQLLPYLCTDQDYIDSFLKMTRKRRSLPSAHTQHETTVLRSEYVVVSQWLEKLQGVSLIVTQSSRRTGSLSIHPLTLEFAQLLTNQEAQRDHIREALQVFYDTHDMCRHESPQHMLTHVNHCLRLCSQFGISLPTLDLPPQVTIWLENVSSQASLSMVPLRTGTPVIEIPLTMVEPTTQRADSFIMLCNMAQKQLQGSSSAMTPGQADPLLVKCVMSFRELKRSLQESGQYDKRKFPVPLRQAVNNLSSMARLVTLYPDLCNELGEFLTEV